MKRLIKETYRHFVLTFAIQLIISLLTDFNMYLWEQCLLALVFWLVINWGVEIWQKNRGGTNTLMQIIEDCLSAGIGGVIGVLIANIF